MPYFLHNGVLWETVTETNTAPTTTTTNLFYYADQTAAATTTTAIWWPAAVSGQGLQQAINTVPQQLIWEQQALEVAQMGQQQQLAQQQLNQAAHIAAANNAKHQAASERARGLLLSFLNDAEKAEFETSKRITFKGSHGTEFTISWGKVGNIRATLKNKKHERWCVHPNDHSLPIEDVMLAQMLHLKANENEMRQVANRSAI